MKTFKHFSEKIAIEYLKKEGHLILDHNRIIDIECCKVEIDIISYLPNKDQIHFFEVKSWKSFFIHPVVKEIHKRKNKIFMSYKKFIMEIYNEIQQNKSEDNIFLCLFKDKNLWEISFSYNLIWIHNHKVEVYYNIFLET